MMGFDMIPPFTVSKCCSKVLDEATNFMVFFFTLRFEINAILESSSF